MSPMLMIASGAITAALFFYTAGVFAERKAGNLKGLHLALFWLGLACDTTGTTFMTLMARTSGQGAPAIHGITGLAAIVLMLFHAVWATAVYVQGKKHEEKAIERERTFHRFSTIVWLLWLVPYIIGLLVGIPMIKLGTAAAVVVSVVIVGVLAAILLKPKRS